MSKLAICGFEANSFNEAFSMAEKLAASDFVPKDKRGKPMDCLLAMQYAKDVGLEPLYGLQNIAVINGKPTLYGDALMALAKGHRDFISCDEKIDGEGDNMVAVCTIQRTNHQPIIGKFSVADAKLAKLWQKKGKYGDSPWVTYPKRMLQMRARGFAVRDAFPDALAGLISVEEAQDYAAKTINVTPVVMTEDSKEPLLTKMVQPIPDSVTHADDFPGKLLPVLPADKLHEAITFINLHPSKVEAVIERLEAKYRLGDYHIRELHQLAMEAADKEAAVNENEEPML